MTDLPVGPPVAPGTFQAPRREGYEGRYVRLRAPEPEADASWLHPRTHGEPRAERLWTYLPYGPFPDPQAMRGWLGECAESSDPQFLTVVERATGRPIGMAAFQRLKAAMRVAEVAHIWYVPASQRTAANTETLYLMLDECFERMGCRRVEWKCDSLNAASRRAALRLGFTFEGIFRRHMLVKGRSRDTAWYAMLDDDWPRLKPLYERSLYSEGERLSLSELTAAARATT